MTASLEIGTPSSWSWMRLKHVVTYLSRGTSPDYGDNGHVRVISQASNQANGLDWSRTRFHRHDGSPKRLKGFLVADDILVNSTGTGTLGRIGFFSGGPDSAQCIADGHITIIRPDDSYVLPKYLYYWLAARPFQEYIASSLVVGATNQIELSRERLAAASALLPPIAEQSCIVDFLNAEVRRVDDVLDMRRAQLIALDEQEPSLLHKHISSVDSATIRVKHLTTRITSGPRGWGNLSDDEGSPFIRIANVPRRGISLMRERLMHINAPAGPERERTRTLLGDVLVTITADIGSVGVVDEGTIDGNVSQHISLVRPEPKRCHPEWLAYAIKSPAARQQLDAKSYGGTKVGLGLDDIAELRLPESEYAEQCRVVDAINESLHILTGLRNSILRQISVLVERRQALITAAVTGQIDVSTVSGAAV